MLFLQDEMVAKPERERENSVHNCVSTSVSEKPLDIFNEALGHFAAVLEATEPGSLSQNETKWFLYLNPA